MRIFYFTTTIFTVLLLALALIHWPLKSLALLRWIVWGTALFGIAVFVKYELSHNTGLWVVLLVVTALLFFPIFPILTSAPLGFTHALAGGFLFISGLRAFFERKGGIRS